jgi:1,4-dihydroxy-2-naphthoyl-CoA hydrolase
MEKLGSQSKNFSSKAKYLSKLHNKTAFDLIGGKYTKIQPKLVEASFKLNRVSQQIFGLMHGGVYAYVAESIASLGTWVSCHSKDSICVGLDISATHLRPFYEVGATVTAKAVAIKQGKSIHVWSVHFFNKKKELLSIAQCTVFIKDLNIDKSLTKKRQKK